MPKALCLTAMVISILVLLLFFSDFLLGFVLKQTALAPFKGASPMTDIVFSVCAGILGFLSFMTFKEQV